MKIKHLFPALMLLLAAGCAGNARKDRPVSLFRPDPYDQLAEKLSEGSKYLANKKVAVLPFSYTDKRLSIDGENISERLLTRMINRHKLEVVERSLIAKVMGELNFQRTGAADERSIKGLGKILGVEAVATGTLTKRRNGWIEINARLIRTETGDILAAASEMIFPDWEASAVPALTPPAPGQVPFQRPIPVQAAPRNVLPPGLIAYYPFNGNANDESGHGNNGSVSGPVPTEDRFGNSGRAFQFSGNNNYIRINNSSSLEIGYGDYTIAAWIKTGATNEGRIFSKGSSECLTGYMMRLGDSSVLLENASEGSCLVRFAGTKTVNDNRWHFVAGVVDRHRGGKIYIDGNLDSEVYKPTSSYDLSNGRSPMIGYNDVGNAFEPFNGSIDDMYIFNRALSAEEVKGLFDLKDETRRP